MKAPPQEPATPENPAHGRPCGLRRRFAAAFYDALLLFGVLYAATAVVLLLRAGDPVPPNTPWFMAYLAAVAYLYFAGQWAGGGRTLGMRSWRLRLVTAAGGAVGWAAASRRVASALISWLPCGAGFLWSLLDHDRRAWHDHLSGTYLVHD